MIAGNVAVPRAPTEPSTATKRADAVLDLAGVTKVFGDGPAAVHALGPLDLTIAQGSFVSIVGPSGCGKSTLLRIVAGLEEHTEGSILRGGVPLVGPSREVGIVFQDHVL